jgi:predicted site-specific integrase-resolvase
VLDIKPDTFRKRIRLGRYPEAIKVGGKRRFSEKDIRKIIQITQEKFPDKK